MQKREPLLTEEHFDKALQRGEKFITKCRANELLDPQEVRLDLVKLSLFRRYHDIIELKYSRGHPLEEIKADFVTMVDALEAFRRFPDPDGDPEGLFFNGEQDEYMQAVELVSMALLLHIDSDVFRRLVAAIGAGGQDYVLEWLISRRLPERRPQTTHLLFPKTYARLRDAIQAPHDLTPPLLKSFLSGWYESLDTVWYNIHAHRQDAAGFTGYWCWEAAAAAHYLSVDDAELRTMRYYPSDLADFARRPEPRRA